MEPVDVNSIREAVRKRYAEVSSSPAGRFEYLTGRGGARDLGYEPRMLDAIPDDILVAFCGVGHPFALGPVATEGAELSRNPPSTLPGGRLQFADIVLKGDLAPEVVGNLDVWSD